MKAVLLIAANFVRENRWPMLTLLVYVILFGLATSFVADPSGEDVVFFLRSVGVYGLAFTGLMAASGIYNERRSRRILAVLSKSVERSQYLGGLLLGAMLDAAIYCLAVGAIGTLALARHGLPVISVWDLVAVLMAAFLLAGTAAMFFSTFLHPMLAAAAAGLSLAGMAMLGQMLGPPWPTLFPAYKLASAMISFGVMNWQPPWAGALVAVIQSAIFWTLATLVFGRRDIAVAVE